MGIFSLFGKRKSEPQPARSDDEWVTVQVKKSELEAFDRMMDFADAFNESPEREAWARKHEEEERRILAELEEQQARRRAALEGLGVSVGCITVDRGRSDLLGIANSLCGLDLAALGPCERDTIEWKPLTRTGKVPKCVAIYHASWDLRNGGFSGGLVACEVSYLADGTPYAAWINDLRGSGTFYKMKTVDGKLALIAANPA